MNLRCVSLVLRSSSELPSLALSSPLGILEIIDRKNRTVLKDLDPFFADRLVTRRRIDDRANRTVAHRQAYRGAVIRGRRAPRRRARKDAHRLGAGQILDQVDKMADLS